MWVKSYIYDVGMTDPLTRAGACKNDASVDTLSIVLRRGLHIFE